MAVNFDNISLKLLELVIKSGSFCVQVMGIWPYRYDRKSKSFYTTKLLTCYTTVVLLFIIFAYIFALKNIKINDDVRVHVPSSTARLTTVLLSFLVILGYSISSIYLVTSYSSIIEWLKKSKKVVEKIHHFREGCVLMPFSRPVVHFILTVVLINGFLIYASIGILSNLISDRTAGKHWLIAFYILPNVTVTIICDIFYGFMLTTNYYYRLLNHHLGNIVNEMRSNSSEKTENTRKYILMEKAMHLIDEIDKLAVLHLEVTTCTRLLNQIFSVHLMCFMASEIFVFISKLFIVYVIIEFDWRREQAVQFNYCIVWYNVVVVIMLFWIVYLLCHSCHTTMKEVLIIKSTHHAVHNRTVHLSFDLQL